MISEKKQTIGEVVKEKVDEYFKIYLYFLKDKNFEIRAETLAENDLIVERLINDMIVERLINDMALKELKEKIENYKKQMKARGQKEIGE
jgi:hypothetical protein